MKQVWGFVLALCVSAVASAQQEEPVWRDGSTLGDKQKLEQTTVCTDEKGHYVVVAPDEQQLHRLYWGSEKEMTRVAPPPTELSGDWFYEPRAFNPNNNENLRGIDLRVFSQVKVGESCVVTCGTQKTTLSKMTADKAQALLLAARYTAPSWLPGQGGLLSDGKGHFYLQDFVVQKPGAQPQARVFVGKKGQLKEQKSPQGQIVFETGFQYAQWLTRNKSTSLSPVPVGPHLAEFFNEAGVYKTARLGNPCDVFAR